MRPMKMYGKAVRTLGNMGTKQNAAGEFLRRGKAVSEAQRMSTGRKRLAVGGGALGLGMIGSRSNSSSGRTGSPPARSSGGRGY